MVRFDRFDTEDSKKCDDNDKNDHKGANSVFEMTFSDSEGTFTNEKFCHTLGEDRQNHRNNNERSIIRNFEGNNPKTFKHRFGENLMGWTQLDTSGLTLDFAVGTGANPNGWYKGFRLEWALESSLEVADLKQQILDFIENYSFPETLKSARAGAIKRYFNKKIAKAHKQNGQKCVTTATFVPHFVEVAWRQVDSLSKLATFLSPETDRQNQTGFKGYFNFVHGGCWKKIDSLENMDNWNQRFNVWVGEE